MKPPHDPLSNREFGPFRLDPLRRRLWRGGELIPLTPKAMETLIALVARAGEVVEKDQLLAEVWPGTFVTDDTLAQNISTLRKALEDTSERHVYIETVPRRGYRFAAPVCIAEIDSLPPGPPQAAEVLGPRLSSRERLAWIFALLCFLIGSIGIGALIVGHRTDRSNVSNAAFVVLPPAGTTFSESASVLAVSPDGRHLAFIAIGADGARRLWVRALDSLTPKELPGTQDALAPFWSWDSEYLGFFAAGKLKKISILGGPPVTLCDAPGREHGGTWNREGTILFNAAIAFNRSRLFRVPAIAGTALAVTAAADSTESFQGLPEFLPDGRHFLYVARTGEGPSHLYLGRLDSTDRTYLFSVDSQAHYTNGFLLFHRAGTLFAHRFDAATRTLAGSAIPVRTERIGYNTTGGRAMFSASEDGVLAYRPAPPRQLVWFDRRGTPSEMSARPATTCLLRCLPMENE